MKIGKIDSLSFAWSHLSKEEKESICKDLSPADKAGLSLLVGENIAKYNRQTIKGENNE